MANIDSVGKLDLNGWGMQQAELVGQVGSISTLLSRISDEQGLLTTMGQYAGRNSVSSIHLSYFQSEDEEQSITVEDVATWSAAEGVQQVDLSRMNAYRLDKAPLASLWQGSAVVFVDDVQTDTRLSDEVRSAVTDKYGQTLVIVPLNYKGQQQGVITFAWTDKHDFSSDERLIHENLIETLAAIVFNRRAYLETEVVRRRYEIIAKTNAALGQATNENDILNAVRTVVEQYGVGLSTLNFTHYGEKGTVSVLEIVAIQMGGNAMPLDKVPGGSYRPADATPLTGLMLSEAGPLFIEDMYSDPRAEAGATREHAKVAKVTAMISLPLKNNDRWQGCLVFSWPEAHVFPAELREILSVITPTVTAVVANRRLLMQAEKLYQTSEERLGVVVNSAPVILYAVDADGKFVLSEGKGLENFGLKPNELVGRSVFDFYHDNPQLVADNRRALAGESFTSTADINSLAYQTWYSPVKDKAGQVTGTISVAIDVTDLKRVEGEREGLIKELEEALLFKDQFLATMSHELRTPMNAVLGYSGIALMQDDVPLSIQNMLERIKVNSKRLLSLLNDILDISRINAKRIEIVARNVALPELVQGWQNDFRQQALDKGIELELDLDTDLPAMIVGDEERLTQIASNLINNAIKFTDKGKVRINATARGDQWMVQVSDTGIGIPETWQHLIFDEFRQVDGSSRRKYGGAGLGLSIVQKLCILMGGSITVSSKLGEGSTFTVMLPLRVPTLVSQLS